MLAVSQFSSKLKRKYRFDSVKMLPIGKIRSIGDLRNKKVEFRLCKSEI